MHADERLLNGENCQSTPVDSEDHDDTKNFENIVSTDLVCK